LCFYANAFVAGKNQDTIVMPKTPEGLQVTFDGEVHPSLSERFKNTPGVILVFHDGHCLCNYKDWKILFEHVEKIRQLNDIDKVPLMLFFVGTDYTKIRTMEFDLEIDKTTAKPEVGVVLFVGISIERRLTMNAGKQISLLFKNGKTVIGTLTNYQVENQYGEIVTDKETIYFNTGEIRHIDAIV